MGHASHVELHSVGIDANGDGAVLEQPSCHGSFVGWQFDTWKQQKISIFTPKIANSQFSRHKAQNLNFHAKNRKILIFTPISLPPETSTSTLALLKWHVSSSPSYLQSSSSSSPPIFLIALQAFSGRPPLHPLSNLSQSTSSCSEKERSSPCLILYWPSTLPVTLNAQHDPQEPKSRKINFGIPNFRNFYLDF